MATRLYRGKGSGNNNVRGSTNKVIGDPQSDTNREALPVPVPGKVGDTPYIKNGKWWIGNIDTGIDAEGPKGDPAVLIVDTVAELKALPQSEIDRLVSGDYKCVQLNGYYAKDDTPDSIEYYYYTGDNADDGGSVFSFKGIKVSHDFGKDVDSVYFGSKYGDLPDSFLRLNSALNYAIKSNRRLLISNKGYEYKISQSLNLGTNSNYSVIGILNPIINCYTEGSSAIYSIPELNNMGFIVNPNSVIMEGDYQLSLTKTDGLDIGDVIRTYTTEPIGNVVTRYLKGEYFRITEIDRVKNILTLDHSVGVDINDVSKVEIIKPTVSKNVNIDGITFISKGDRATVARFDHLADSSITSCFFRTSTKYCYVALQVIGYNTVVDDCYSENAFDPALSLGYGFNISGRSVTVKNSTAKSCKHGATVASLTISSDIKFLNCKVYDSIGQKALDIHGAAYDCTIDNCDVYSSAGFINLRGFKGMRARSNNYFGNKDFVTNQQAVAIYGEATGVMDGLDFSRNHIENFNGAVITSQFSTRIKNATIVSNTSFNSGRFLGLFSLFNLSREVIVENSTIQFNVSTGTVNPDVEIQITGSDNKISHNNLGVFQGGGIAVTGTTQYTSRRNTVENNILLKKGDSVVANAIANSYTEGSIVRFNECSNGFNNIVSGAGDNVNLISYGNNSDSIDGFGLPSEFNTFNNPSDITSKKLISVKSIVDNSVWWRDVNMIVYFKGSVSNTSSFDNHISTGYYLLGAASTTPAQYNIPSNEGGILNVVFTNTLNIKQEFVTRTAKVYVRYRFNSIWSSWNRIDNYLDIVTSRPTLINGETRVIIESPSNKMIWGLGTSGATVWRDVNGVVV